VSARSENTAYLGFCPVFLSKELKIPAEDFPFFRNRAENPHSLPFQRKKVLPIYYLYILADIKNMVHLTQIQMRWKQT